jgi:hypothetical protein
MGLLDDAIREHLDLKRRRGADPAEVERAEREALGPVRRGPEGPEQVDPGLEEPLAYDHEAQEDWDESFEETGNGFALQESAQSEPFDETDPRFDEEPPPPRAAAQPPQFEEFEEPATGEAEPFVDAGPSATPPPHAAAEPPPADKHQGGETVEYEVEGALEQEGGAEDADMLEETPDFLQDTPDHDRLWFEQRPPRDFDFDG